LFKKLTLLCFLIFSCLSFAEETPQNTQDSKTKELFSKGQSLIAGGVDGLVNEGKSYANEKGVGVTKSFLEKYFPTVEIQLDMFDKQKPTSGILIVVPLSDPKDIKNTFFMQDSVYHKDNRTTVNLGLGYRRLEMDNKLLLGVNAFYDHEFPYDHGRTSIGLEARTTIGEVNFNQYFAATDWKTTKGTNQEHALGGTDLEVGVPLPYMNWAKLYGRGFIWYGEDNTKDLKGGDISLRAQVPGIPGLSVEGGRRLFSTTGYDDQSFLRVNLNITDLYALKTTQPLFSERAYSFDSMENQRYAKVRRENLIVKQKKGGIGVKGT
jgi:Inverse autotransporter, beta-domain